MYNVHSLNAHVDNDLQAQTQKPNYKTVQHTRDTLLKKLSIKAGDQHIFFLLLKRMFCLIRRNVY